MRACALRQHTGNPMADAALARPPDGRVAACACIRAVSLCATAWEGCCAPRSRLRCLTARSCAPATRPCPPPARPESPQRSAATFYRPVRGTDSSLASSAMCLPRLAVSLCDWRPPMPQLGGGEGGGQAAGCYHCHATPCSDAVAVLCLPQVRRLGVGGIGQPWSRTQRKLHASTQERAGAWGCKQE